MYAIVKTGGKQYTVAVGDKINVEKLDAEVGAMVTLPALFVADGNEFITDPAKAAAVKVEAKVLEQFKGEKVFVLKFKKRKSYKKRNGHRQLLTRVEITSIVVNEAPKAAAKKPAKVAEVAEVAEVAAEEKPAKAPRKTAAKKAAEPAVAAEEAPKKKAPAKKAAPKAEGEEVKAAEAAPKKKAPAKKAAPAPAEAQETAE